VPDARLRAVDGLRAIAVLGVVAHHAGLVPWSIGARGVELFFVISGFCLSLPALARVHAGLPFRFDWRQFAIGRVARIVPPYYAALALFVGLSATSFGVPTVFAPPFHNEWLFDALFLTSRAPAYNASFWTLGVEARWYLVFPAVLALYATSRRGFMLLGLVCYAVALIWNSPLDVGILPCFMLGIVAAGMHVRGKAGSPWFVVAAFAALALAAAVDRTESPSDPLWHAAAFLTLLAGIGAGARVVSWRPLAFVGTASYSIYLVHQPVLMWLAGVPMPWALRAVLSIAAGLAFWRAVEVPSLAVARKLRKRRVALAGGVAA
jgi:peptidoglycan/LPS O-acetylase OafA/YrhL